MASDDAYLAAGLDDVFVPAPVAGAVWTHTWTHSGEVRSTGLVLAVYRVSRSFIPVPGLSGHYQEVPEDKRDGWDVILPGSLKAEFWSMSEGRALLPRSSVCHPGYLSDQVEMTWSHG